MRILYFCVAFSITINSWGQNHDRSYSVSPDTLRTKFIEYKWVVFISEKISYNITQYNFPEGHFGFRLGFSDSSEILKQTCIEQPNSHYTISTKYIPGIDTIISFSTIDPGSASLNVEVEEIKNCLYARSELLDLVKFSYIMNKLSRPKLSEDHEIVMRLIDPGYPVPSKCYNSLVYPVEMLPNQCYGIDNSKDYDLIEIRVENGIPKYIFVKGESSDAHGLRVTETRTGHIRKKIYDKLKDKVAVANDQQPANCKSPGSPWLMEIRAGSVISHALLSDECIMRSKGHNSFAELYSMINSVFRNSRGKR